MPKGINFFKKVVLIITSKRQDLKDVLAEVPYFLDGNFEMLAPYFTPNAIWEGK